MTEGERVSLSAASAEDAGALSALMTPGISRWTAAWPDPTTPDHAQALLDAAIAARGVHPFVIVERATGATAGWMKVAEDVERREADLGYWIGEAFQGRGYAREAAEAAIRFAFRDLDARAVVAGAQIANDASHRLLGKLGFTRTEDADVWAPARARMEACGFWRLERTGGLFGEEVFDLGETGDVRAE